MNTETYRTKSGRRIDAMSTQTKPATDAEAQRRKYEQYEARLFRQQLQNVETAPLIERRAARRAWGEALTEYPELVAERIGWLLNGSYGYGAHIAALQTVNSPRMNVQAWLGQTIAALEWHCPSLFAHQVWKKLPPAQQGHLAGLIQQEIDECVAEQEESDA